MLYRSRRRSPARPVHPGEGVVGRRPRSRLGRGGSTRQQIARPMLGRVPSSTRCSRSPRWRAQRREHLHRQDQPMAEQQQSLDHCGISIRRPGRSASRRAHPYQALVHRPQEIDEALSARRTAARPAGAKFLAAQAAAPSSRGAGWSRWNGPTRWTSASRGILRNSASRGSSGWLLRSEVACMPSRGQDHHAVVDQVDTTRWRRARRC